MAAKTDKAGRPIVVVTGLGVVTSLGEGKADNWARLTAGESGIHKITRFPTDNLKTNVAGSVDFLSVEPFSAPSLTETLSARAAEEAVAQSNIGTRGNFPGPLFLAMPPVELEWTQRIAVTADLNQEAVGYDELLRASGADRFSSYHERFLFGSRARSSSASRPSAAARPTPRSALPATARSMPRLWCASHFFPRSRPRTIRRKVPPSPSPRTVTVLSWRKAPARWCWKAWNRRRRAARRSLVSWKAPVKWRMRSTARVRAPTASRSSAASTTR
jgi:hypothetical protein